MCRAHIALQEPQAVAIILYKMAFCLPGKVVACTWITALQRLICVIRMVQYLLFFPDGPAGYCV